jgi:hypothetical protein
VLKYFTLFLNKLVNYEKAKTILINNLYYVINNANKSNIINSSKQNLTDCPKYEETNIKHKCFKHFCVVVKPT